MVSALRHAVGIRSEGPVAGRVDPSPPVFAPIEDLPVGQGRLAHRARSSDSVGIVRAVPGVVYLTVG
jgi:hypothetical protein